MKLNLLVVLVQAVGVAEVAVQVVTAQVPVQLVVVHVALVAELADRMAPVRTVVLVTHTLVSGQLLACVAAPLMRQDLTTSNVRYRQLFCYEIQWVCCTVEGVFNSLFPFLLCRNQ